MDNLSIYNAVRTVPDEAKKAIQAGRLKGKTDINPMWRIKTLTERFGPCGIGWKYAIVRQWLEPAPTGEIGAFVEINLYIKHEGAWSDAIPGVGGSMFAAKESAGMHISDECYKMALTDAVSVSCKALGVAADVYWDKDRTKYTEKPESAAYYLNNKQLESIFALSENNQELCASVITGMGYADLAKIKVSDYGAICDAVKARAARVKSA